MRKLADVDHKDESWI